MHMYCYWLKLPNLELKTVPKQLLGSLLLGTTMDKPQLTRQNLDWVFNSRSGHLYSKWLCCYWLKLPNLELKTWQKQLGCSLLSDIIHGQTSANKTKFGLSFQLKKWPFVFKVVVLLLIETAQLRVKNLAKTTWRFSPVRYYSWTNLS